MTPSTKWLLEGCVSTAISSIPCVVYYSSISYRIFATDCTRRHTRGQTGCCCWWCDAVLVRFRGLCGVYRRSWGRAAAETVVVGFLLATNGWLALLGMAVSVGCDFRCSLVECRAATERTNGTELRMWTAMWADLRPCRVVLYIRACSICCEQAIWLYVCVCLFVRLRESCYWYTQRVCVWGDVCWFARIAYFERVNCMLIWVRCTHTQRAAVEY